MADTSDNQEREHFENETTKLIDNEIVTMLEGKENIILVKFMKKHDDAKIQLRLKTPLENCLLPPIYSDNVYIERCIVVNYTFSIVFFMK